MTHFFRLLVRLRYWKRRALALQRERDGLITQFAIDKATLERQNQAEFWRNISREDMFASAATLGTRNMFGLAPRVGPAPINKPPSLLEAAKPMMTGADRMEFEVEWWPFAERNGFTRQQAEKSFLKELSKRQPLHDEPTIG